jgi:DNA primase
MRIRDGFIEKVVWRADIVAVIRHYLGKENVRQRSVGYEFVALCPFHGERTPSFTITSRKQFYHCFGCGAHGRSINFVQAMEHIESYTDAALRVVEITKLSIPTGKTNLVRARRRVRTSAQKRTKRLARAERAKASIARDT